MLQRSRLTVVLLWLHAPAEAWQPAGTRAYLETWGPCRGIWRVRRQLERNTAAKISAVKVLFVGALCCDDVAGRVRHVAEEGVEEVIFQEGLFEDLGG